MYWGIKICPIFLYRSYQIFSSFLSLKTILRIPLRNLGLSITRIFICFPPSHRFISINPATTSVTAVITTIHSEGNIHTATIPKPNATNAIPVRPLFLLLLRLKIIPPCNERSSHYTEKKFFGASPKMYTIYICTN